MAFNENWSIKDILYLKSYKGANSNIIRQVIDNYNSLEDFSNSVLPSKLSLIFSQSVILSRDDSKIEDRINNIIEICQKENYQIISIWDENYPVLLREIHYPPILIFVKGNLSERKANVAIVGKRRCSEYGRYCSELFAGYLAKNNVIIISGLAEGIDSYSHIAAMDAGGITFAIIASGLDCILPTNKNQLANQIVESGGAVISEYAPGIKAKIPYFPQRNRIISGMSKGVIVIESAERGGSLITAHFAFDQGREVYAVPGNITLEKSVGANLLIKKNFATIAISPEMVFDDLGLNDGKTQRNLFVASKIEELLDNDNQKLVYDLITSEPEHIDDISLKAQLDMPEILVLLLELELKGIVKQLPGKYYVK